MARARLVGDWERELKRRIGRRYGDMARDRSFAPGGADKLTTAGYPGDWVRRLPKDIAAAYSGCGFPFAGLAFDKLRRVVDLGCGAGIDALYIAQQLAPGGTVTAIDLAPEMLARAAGATGAAGWLNRDKIRFLAADMERLPLAPECADLVVANASLNLAADKGRALGEMFRILAPGGRFVARDLVRNGPLPAEVLSDPLSYNTSLGGALEEKELYSALSEAGFAEIEISDHRPFSMLETVLIRAAKAPV